MPRCRVTPLPRRPPVRRWALRLRTALPGLLALLPWAAAWPAQAAGAAEAAHVHGGARLELVIEPRSISLALDVPQHSLLGHEHAPRTPAEQQAAAELLARLRDGARLWPLPPGLKCVQRSAEVEAPLLQRPAPSAAAAAAALHADIEARWQFACARVDGLRQLDIGPLLDAFGALQQVQAQVVSPSGQYQASARRPQRLLAWGR
jgi:hypothetical protein